MGWFPLRGAAGALAARAVVAWLAAGCVAAAAAAPAVADAAPPATPAQRLLQLEASGRAQPRAAAEAIGRMVAEGGASAPWLLDALTLQGLLLAGASDSAAAEAVARRLDALPGGGAAAADWVRARAAEQTGDVAAANRLIDGALARLPKDASAHTRQRLYASLARIRDGASRLEDAIRAAHEALKLADALPDAWRRAEARNELAWAYFQARQLDPARRLSAEALAIAERDADPMTLAHVHTVRGIVQDALGDRDGQRASFQAALHQARAAGAKYEESLYLANLADFYLKQGDFPTALRYASLALPLTRELGNLNGETVALANIGLAQIGMRDVEAGKQRLRESIAIDERRGSVAGVSDTYAEMGAYLERAGDAAGAIEALHQHRLLADQVLQRDRQRAIVEMQERFDAERRARELELLERDARLKAEALRAQALRQRLAWLLAACGGATLAVVAILLRRVRRTNAQLAHSNARLEQQAGVDPLTGLANRRRFLAAMQRDGADRAFTGSVLLADLDHFKRINDEHGHAAGDAVLVQVAERLRAVLRDADLIVRWGGEEFLVVVRALGADAVHALAQRMLDAIGGRAFVHEGRELHTTVSIGWATFPIEPALLAAPWERAIALVDTALYLAKAHGRNRAYGVRRVHARDLAQLEAIGRALEDAWMAGEVALAQVEGPRRAPAAALPEAVAEAA